MNFGRKTALGGLRIQKRVDFGVICSKPEAIAFEPDSISYERCKNALEYSGVTGGIKVINAGLWSESKQMAFKTSGRGGAQIDYENSADNEVSVLALDDWCDANNVIPTYIKMDIEGAEIPALMGCKSIIKEHKPKLAISVYHKTFDVSAIPLLLKS